jgi:hypothetical protein
MPWTKNMLMFYFIIVHFYKYGNLTSHILERVAPQDEWLRKTEG